MFQYQGPQGRTKTPSQQNGASSEIQQSDLIAYFFIFLVYYTVDYALCFASSNTILHYIMVDSL